MEKDFEKGYFDTIRPFNDDEVQAAITRLLDNPHFRAALKFVFPSMDSSTLEAQLKTGNKPTKVEGKITSVSLDEKDTNRINKELTVLKTRI